MTPEEIKKLVIKDPSQLNRVSGIPIGYIPFYIDGEEELQMMSVENFNNLSKTATPLSPTDPTPTVEGLYIPTESGTYANAGGLVAQEGYYTLFFYDGVNWTKSETKLPENSTKIPIWNAQDYSPNDQVIKDNIIYIAPTGATATDIPKESYKWIQIDIDVDIYKVSDSKNLFNKNDVYKDTSYGLSGLEVTFGWSTSKNFIPISGSKVYRQTDSGGYIYYFDSKKEFIERAVNISTSPVNARYARVNTLTSGLDDYMLIENDLPSSYASFKPVFRDEKSLSLINSWSQLGDSWTVKDEWQRIVRNRFNVVKSTPYAITGSCLCRVAGEPITPFIDRYQDVPDSEIISIMGGINDAAANAPIGTLGVLNDNTFIGAYQTIIEWYLTRNPLTKIILMCPSVFWNYDPPRNKNANIENFIKATKDVADYYNLPCFDMNEILGINEKTKNALMTDLVHLNDIGYERLGIAFSEFLKKIN